MKGRGITTEQRVHIYQPQPQRDTYVRAISRDPCDLPQGIRPAISGRYACSLGQRPAALPHCAVMRESPPATRPRDLSGKICPPACATAFDTASCAPLSTIISTHPPRRRRKPSPPVALLTRHSNFSYRYSGVVIRSIRRRRNFTPPEQPRHVLPVMTKERLVHSRAMAAIFSRFRNTCLSH